MEETKGSLGIVGGSGFIGSTLARQATAAGWRVCGFSRRARSPEETVPEWRIWSDHPDLAGISALVNLAGAPVDQRWTDENKRRFRASRVGVTETIRDAIAALPASRRPAVFLNGSAVGIYGDRGNEILEEGAVPGTGYLADLCRDWEMAAGEVAALGPRVLKSRTGVVLGRDGQAFRKMLRPFRLGIGGRLGSGRQWMPWIHVDDLAAAMLHALDQPALEGPFNGTAPEPERNVDFTRKLARAVHRPAIIPAPAFALKLVLGDFADVVLSSQRAVPAKLRESGFRFRFPTLELALEDLLSRGEPAS